MINAERLNEIREIFLQVETEDAARQESLWNSLSPEHKLDLFCAVVRRIHQAELVDRDSYRGVLYGVFGFGLEAYSAALSAGYLELHNSIMSEQDILFEIRRFCEFHGLDSIEEKLERWKNRNNERLNMPL